MKKVKVLKEFRDKVDHKTMYHPGLEVETFDDVRVADLVARGWVEEVIEQIETIHGSIDLAKAANDIEVAVNATTDIEVLLAALSAEQKLKNRVGVQNILDKRIDELKAAEEHELSVIAASEDVAALKEMLATEKALDNPRQVFVSAITDRIVAIA